MDSIQLKEGTKLLLGNDVSATVRRIKYKGKRYWAIVSTWQSFERWPSYRNAANGYVYEFSTEISDLTYGMRYDSSGNLFIPERELGLRNMER